MTEKNKLTSCQAKKCAEINEQPYCNIFINATNHGQNHFAFLGDYFLWASKTSDVNLSVPCKVLEREREIVVANFSKNTIDLETNYEFGIEGFNTKILTEHYSEDGALDRIKFQIVDQ